MEDTLHIDIIDPTGYGTGALNAVYMQMKGAKGRPIRAVVNEYGGNVLDGIGIHNLFRGHDAPVEAHIPAFAISAHTIVSSGASRVTMAENGYFMVHNPWAFAMGEAEEMQKQADLLASIKGQIVDIYHRKTGLDKKRLSEMMDKETWLTAQEALDLGFVDALTEGADIRNCVKPEQLSAFQNVPAAMLANFSQKKSNQMNPFEQAWNAVRKFFGAAETSSIDEVKAEMEKHGTLAEMKAALRTEIETDLNARHAQAVADLNAAHETELTAAQDALAAAQADLTAAQARIAELEKEPAGEHTHGPNGSSGQAPQMSEFTARAVKNASINKGLPKW